MKKQLKQELKNQETRKNKKKPGKKICFIVLFVVLGLLAAIYPLYQQYELTVPQRILAKGIKKESLGELDVADQIYRHLIQSKKGTEEGASALFRLARMQQYDYQNERQALLFYLQLEKDYPDNPLVHSAREESARIVKYGLRDYSQAIGFYQRLLTSEKGTLDRYLYEIADCYFRLENYSQSRIELETLIDSFPQSELIADALYRRGNLLVLEKRTKEARQNWLKLIEMYPQSHYRPQAELNLAKLLEEEDYLVEALNMYQKLDNFPRPAMLEEKIESLKKRIEAKKKAI